MRKKIIVGIDEVGRGPLAGPVMIGIVASHGHLPIPGIADSKRMTAEQRAEVALAAEPLVAQGVLRYGVYAESAKTIDAHGIQVAIRRAIARGLAELAIDPRSAELALDAGLVAPPEFFQQSIVHGDALVPAIGLAAILAKTERDRFMASVLARKYPAYGFADHKGYGTPAHRAALRLHGPSPAHRLSFLTRLVVSSPHE